MDFAGIIKDKNIEIKKCYKCNNLPPKIANFPKKFTFTWCKVSFKFIGVLW